MQWFGTKVLFNRFLGQIDADDPTNLPIGAAALCRNTDFTRETPGAVTSATTRCGNNLAIQLIGLDGNSSTEQATGGIFFEYEPQLPSDADLFPPAGYFQMPILFEKGGCLQREWPVGTGHTKKLPASPLFTPPTGSHMLGCSAGNKVFAAFTDLFKPTSYGVCINPKAVQTNAPLAVNPLGMKPFGWYWQPNTEVIVGEYACPPSPVTGNGHTYRCITAGTTGAAAPTFLTGEGDEFNDGTARWKESTMVMANRLPPPAPLVIADFAGGGTFPGGQDIYIVVTYENPQGESLPSLPSKIVNLPAGDSVRLTFPNLADVKPGWIPTLAPQYLPDRWHVFLAAVPTGNPAPPLSDYRDVATFGPPITLGFSINIPSPPGATSPPPTTNTARITPGQLPTPDTQPDIQRVPLGGTFPAGRDVYTRQTYKNAIGETKAGPASSILNTVLNDGVQVTIEVPEDDESVALFAIDSVGIYEADVPTGTPAPPASEFSLVGFYTVGATPIITTTASGANPPTTNTTGPGGAIAADTTTGGANGGQGYRWTVPLFMNQNETVSGFTIAAATRYDVDEDGWEIAVFFAPIGPSNIVARLIAFTGADSSQAGPFSWIGLINLLVPSVDVVYPTMTLIDEVEQSATAILDNTTTSATFNFTDRFLAGSNNVDDRTDILPPFKAQRIDFLKSINALAYSGVLGYTGGGLISIPGDYESVYADTGAVPFPADGEKCYGFTDKYKSTIFAMRSKSGYALQPNTGNPSGWEPVRRWDQVGPCGPRAWDAINKFICFVDPSGFYKYDESDPDLMSKEIPASWARINWKYAEKIAVTIDEHTHTVRIQVPTGQSTENNEEFCLSYLEGWQNPIHFSTYTSKESAMDAARRWSFNDIAATFAMRMDRKLPPGPAYIDGPNWEAQQDSSFGLSQLLFFDSAPDGAIQARVPGSRSDNGAGIDWQWESVCAGLMQAVTKPEGINLNVSGYGQITASFLCARDQDAGPGGPAENEFPLGDGQFSLVSNQRKGITIKCEHFIGEYFRVRFTNAKQPDAWASLKQMELYLIPFTVGWDSSDG